MRLALHMGTASAGNACAMRATPAKIVPSVSAGAGAGTVAVATVLLDSAIVNDGRYPGCI